MSVPDSNMIRLFIKKVGDTMRDKMLWSHGRSYSSQFNEWFEIEGVVKLYVRKGVRAVPAEMYEALKGVDTTERQAQYGQVRIPTLELASIDVHEGYGNKGVATFCITQLEHIADYFQHYFMIENVHNAQLRGFLMKRRESFMVDRRTYPDCFYRVFHKLEKPFNAQDVIDEYGVETGEQALELMRQKPLEVKSC